MTTVLDFCVSCAAPGAQRVACAAPTVEAWWCAVCGGRWWFSVVTPQLCLARLAGQVVVRSVLREVIELAEAAAGLSDEQLRARALSVLAALDQHARTWPE